MNEPIYEQMQQLIQQIRQADTAYYKHDAPIMSDLEYDRLMDDLVALEEESGVILSNSPTQHVAGETLETLMEVRHTKPMLSAAKTKSVDDLIRFASSRDVLLSWKMDGLTLVLRYENGHLTQAITRGRDGIIGEDVTHTVKTFLNVPLTIPISEAFEVRGEGVISWKNFDTINADLDDAYIHPTKSGSRERAKAGRFGSAEADAGILGIRSGQRQLGIRQQARAAEAFGVLRLQCGPISVSAFLMQRP